MTEARTSRRGARSVGVLGFGAVGRYLCETIRNDPAVAAQLELAFVYNRSPARLDELDVASALRVTGEDAGAAVAAHVASHGAPDLLVEVCHPDIVGQHGAGFLGHSDLYVASVTALADAQTGRRLAAASSDGGHALYVPSGAAWGIADIVRMDGSGRLTGLAVTMTFHAAALRLCGALESRLAAYVNDPQNVEPLVLFEGSVEEIAPLAPNNVNTMAAVALAGASLGPERTRATLVAQKADDAHTVEIEVTGRDGFFVNTRRYNPAKPGAVTGGETYPSFLASLLRADGQSAGVHFC